MDYTLIRDLATEAQPPENGILSRTLFQDAQIKVVLFAFSPGQELSEHSASVPAVVHVLRGEATLQLGEETIEAGPGTWVHMPPRLKHGVQARTALTMLLLMLKAQGP
jgi:quercetin dioxygenase-like cupin family protein